MQSKFSTINVTDMNISFWVTTNQRSPDALTVEVNNNVGSGDVSLFSSSATIVDEQQTVSLPASMETSVSESSEPHAETTITSIIDIAAATDSFSIVRKWKPVI